MVLEEFSSLGVVMVWTYWLCSYYLYFLDLDSKIPEDNISVHVINIDIQDNHEEATIGAFLICELANMVKFIS
jgi:hypothetical protein